jgi:hypothetical protein
MPLSERRCGFYARKLITEMDDRGFNPFYEPDLMLASLVDVPGRV